MTHVHEENYTKGHVALYCYDDGFSVGPLPKVQAWEEMRMHLFVEHGEPFDAGFEKLSHSQVVRAQKGRKVPALTKKGGFKRDDIFPDSGMSYPDLGLVIPKFKMGNTSIFSVGGLPDPGNYL